MLFKAPWSTSGDRHFYAQWTTAAKIEADQSRLFNLIGWNVMIPGPPESLDASPARLHPLAVLSWGWATHGPPCHVIKLFNKQNCDGCVMADDGGVMFFHRACVATIDHSHLTVDGIGYK